MHAFGIIPNVPVCLKPSPPAHTHQLTYHQLHKNLMKEQIQKNKVSNLLREIDKLSAVIREQEGSFIQQKQILMKQILLLSIQVQHQREIVGRYDAQLRKLQTGMEDIHSLYELKLETLKRQMIQSFEIQMQNEKQKTFEELTIIRDNYKTKLALIAESHKDKEHELDIKVERENDLLMKIEFMQARVAEKQRTNQTQFEKINMLEEKNDNFEQETAALKEKLGSYQDQTEGLIESLKKQLVQSQSLKKQAFEEFSKLKEANEAIENEKNLLAIANEQLKSQSQSSLRKFLKVQKDYDDLQREFEEKILAFSINKKMPQQMQGQIKNEEWDIFNSKQTKRERDSQATQNYKAIISQNENIQLKLKDNEQIIRQLKIQYEELQQKYELLGQKKGEGDNTAADELIESNKKIHSLKSELTNQDQEHKRALQFVNKKVQGLQKIWEEKEKDLPLIIKAIQQQYLREIGEKKKKIDELEDTLKATNQMFEKQIKSLNQSRRSKGKRN